MCQQQKHSQEKQTTTIWYTPDNNFIYATVVSHKKGDAHRVGDTPQDHPIQGAAGKNTGHFGKTHERAPTHSQVHGEREFAAVFPRGEAKLDANPEDATAPQKRQQSRRIERFVVQDNGGKRGVGTGNQNVNGALVEYFKDPLGVKHGEKGMVQSGARVQDDQ